MNELERKGGDAVFHSIFKTGSGGGNHSFQNHNDLMSGVILSSFSFVFGERATLIPSEFGTAWILLEAWSSWKGAILRIRSFHVYCKQYVNALFSASCMIDEEVVMVGRCAALFLKPLQFFEEG